jgi:heme/copper-type cytochrome/quinol oxidase subunit 2
MRGLPLLAAALVVAAALAVVPAAEAAPTRALTITAATAQPQTPFKGFDGNPAKAFDLDGDGRLEILAQNDNQRLYVFSSATGGRLAELMTTFPAGWGARTFNGPEAYRDADGVAHIVVANSAATVTSFRYDAAASTATGFRFVKEWERRTTDCHANPGMDAKPTLADLDRDGALEILVGVEELGVVALRANGALYWKKCIGGGNGDPAVADLNLDGWPDVVHASDGGVVTAMNGRTGATMWSFSALSRFDLGSASMPVGPGIGQLDGVGGPDVVVGARDSHDAENFTNDHAMLIALDSGGRLLWAKQDLAGGNPLTYTHPIVADAEGDGTNEVYWGDWNTMGHKPPFDESLAWQVTGPGNFYRYSHTGQLVWKQSLGSFWSNKDLALADVDGDGEQEVLANGPNGGHDGIWLLSAATGAKESFVDLYPWMMSRGPVVYDMDGDGGMQLIVEAGPMATSAGPAVMLYDTGAAYSALWPHLPENGPGTPPPPPPPPAGCFAATFTVKSPNAWWQEVSVANPAGKTVTKVEVRWPGNEWQPMAKASWGAWTSSHSTPAGTPVEFLATASDSFASQSLPFTWMDGTLSKGSVPCGTTTTSTTTSGTGTTTTTSSATSTTSLSTSTTSTSTTPTGTTTSATATTSSSSSTSTTGAAFTATFSVPSNVNEWWVEAAVQANQPLATVEAKAGSGAWTALARTDWGTWAKSFNVPAGTPVQFRATSTGNSLAVSQTYTWMGGPPPPPPGGFAATFQPAAVGNDWWVEVRVTASEPLSGVEAKLGTGAWTPLTLQSWGTWAKSLHAPNGTPVQFRATSADGDAATSQTFTWT